MLSPGQCVRDTGHECVVVVVVVEQNEHQGARERDF